MSLAPVAPVALTDADFAAAKKYIDDTDRAAAMKYVKDIIALMDKGLEENHDISECGKNALLLASRGGNIEEVRALLASGAKVGEVGRHGWTSFLKASHDGHMKIAGVLLENGADVNHVNEYGESALTIASQKEGPLDLALWLLRNGDNIRRVDRHFERTSLLDAP